LGYEASAISTAEAPEAAEEAAADTCRDISEHATSAAINRFRLIAMLVFNFASSCIFLPGGGESQIS
jgi:hypothetical protein